MIRRDFLKTASVALGATTLAPWVLDAEALQGAAVDAAKSALADAALDTAARLGASYADIRINRYRYESVATREQQVTNVSRTQHAGFGVRVLVEGTWGFAASSSISPDDGRRVTEAAVAIARANAMFQRKPVVLAPVQKAVATWKSAFQTDPFDVPLDTKIQFLLKLNATAMKTPRVSFVNSSMFWVNEQKIGRASCRERV